jgi:hypothetical protein
MNTSTLALVKSKGNLRKTQSKNECYTAVKRELDNHGDVSELQDDISFILKVCSLIENVRTGTKLTGQDKQDLAVKLLCDIFPALNNSLDVHRLRKSIDFVCDMNLIKVVSTTKKISNSLVCSLKKGLGI